MKTKNKLLENINHELWTKFVAKCRIDGVKVSDRVQELIKEHTYGGNEK